MKSDKIDISYTKAAEAIKVAILNAQYEAAKGVNNIQLMLYYAIGRFISQNTRKQKWGTNAVATISHLLKQDMPGLRGYSESNIKRMRTFYEEWRELDNSPIQTGELHLERSDKAPCLYTLFGWLFGVLSPSFRKGLGGRLN